MVSAEYIRHKPSPVSHSAFRSIALFAALLLALFSLHDMRADGAQLTFSRDQGLFQRGYLALSQRNAELAARQFQISNPEWAEKFQLLEAESMLYRGMYEDALRILDTGRALPGSSDSRVERLAIGSVALTRQQQLDEANRRITQASAICSTDDYPSCGEVFNARAILAAKNDRLLEARESFLDALAFAKNHHNPWLQVTASVNLGYIALQTDRFDEAVDWSNSAYRTAEVMGYENLAQNAAGNLGWAYYESGDGERALELFIAAEKTAAQLGNIRYQLKWLSTAGYVYGDSGDWPHAASSYRQALALAQQINSREDIVNALEDLAQVSVSSGNLEEASAYIARVATMETSNGLRPSAPLTLTMGELAMARHQLSDAERNFDSIRDDPASLMTTRLTAGYELAKLRELQNNNDDAENIYRTTLSTYEHARTQLKSEELQLPFGANAIQIYDSYIQLLLRRGKTEVALAAADQSRARTLEQDVDLKAANNIPRIINLNPRQIAQATNSTLLFYWLGAKQSYLWVITPSKTSLFPLPDEQKITDRVDRYRKSLLDMNDPVRLADPDGQALYDLLIAPAAQLLQSIAPVKILADGILSQLNFETLLAPGPGKAAQRDSDPNSDRPARVHYLLEDLTISSAPSLAMLASAKQSREAGQRMLLVGNPISAAPDFPNLPMFSFEMTHIESHFAPSQLAVFTGETATPSAYLASHPLQYSYIHFVSHAIASSTNPLDSAIILSNSTSRESSYKLYARDIIQRPIDAKLVTISACYGSGTRSYAGEGLVGLTWAFLRAGAQRVIGSLWEVSDDSTPLLMDNLYQGLAKGVPPVTALRQAKLTLLHSPGRFRLPFYWATFQIYSRR